MKKLLVVYYSQTGQLTRIVDSVLKPLADSGQVQLVFEQLRPRTPYPFPWTALEFTDVFPESLQQRGCPLEPLQFDPDAHYDGIILAYQVWYLSPSIPIAAFLQSPEAARVMRNRPVTTIIGCRNMWLQAHEKVKAAIVGHQGRLAGNIVLQDNAPNLLGVISITAWMLTGRKDPFLKIFPKAGISDDDIVNAARFGPILLNALHNDRWDDVQSELIPRGAVRVVPSYILFEQRISKIFAVWAKFIGRQGGAKAPARKPRLRLFIGYLFTAIFLIAPLATMVTFVLQHLKHDKIRSLVTYFEKNSYNAGLCGHCPPASAVHKPPAGSAGSNHTNPRSIRKSAI